MNVLVLLIPVSLALGGLGLCGFLWTLKNAQYDDLEGDAARLLLEDEPDPEDMDGRATAAATAVTGR